MLFHLGFRSRPLKSRPRRTSHLQWLANPKVMPAYVLPNSPSPSCAGVLSLLSRLPAFDGRGGRSSSSEGGFGGAGSFLIGTKSGCRWRSSMSHFAWKVSKWRGNTDAENPYRHGLHFGHPGNIVFIVDAIAQHVAKVP